MSMTSSAQFQAWIQGFNAGDAAARDALIQHAYERLRALTRKMLRDFRRLERWEDADDVLHDSLLRLLAALRAVQPANATEFFHLATLQIRRQLLDLIRHHFGPEGSGANRATELKQNKADSTPPPAYDQPDSSNDPARLARWTEFHQRVENLPDQLRAVFDLVWYHELPQADVAHLLGISVPTVRRRLTRAKLRLMDLLDGIEES